MKSLEFELDGEKVSLSEYCRRRGWSRSAIYTYHYKTGKSIEAIVAEFNERYSEYKHHHGSKFKAREKKEVRFRSIWKGMLYRCTNPNCTAYKDYGDRGITVSDEWLDYNNFYDDMYASYKKHIKVFGKKNTTIDRIDVDKGYCKENCRWATWKEQNRNQRKTVRLDTGEPLKDYCERTGYDYERLRNGLLAGKSIEEIINPIDKKIGKTFGALTVKERIDENNYRCICKCGKEVIKDKRMLYDKSKLPCIHKRGKIALVVEGKEFTFRELVEITGIPNSTLRHMGDKLGRRFRTLDDLYREKLYS